LKTVLKATDAASIQDGAAASFVTREAEKLSTEVMNPCRKAGFRRSFASNLAVMVRRNQRARLSSRI